MFWSPTKICREIFRNVGPRQVTDLAERGIVRPAKETTGKGDARFYDLQGVLEIGLAFTLRSLLPPEEVKEIVEDFRRRLDKTKGGLGWDVYSIARSATTGKTVTSVAAFEELGPQHFRRGGGEEGSKPEEPRIRVIRFRNGEGEREQVPRAGWKGEETNEKPGDGRCDPLDYRFIILNVSDMRQAILDTVGKE